jgi:carbonic anhydrase
MMLQSVAVRVGCRLLGSGTRRCVVAVDRSSVLANSSSRLFSTDKTKPPETFGEQITFEDLQEGDQPWFADDVDLEHLLSNNRRWRDAKLLKDDKYFERLAQGQRPKFLYIGCSDSRIPSNEIMGVGPGAVFVHRNVANLVVATDVNLMSCLQYAVEALQVHHILVTGHYDCGGVKAAMTKTDHEGMLQHWIRNIRDVYRTHREELDAIADEEARHRRLVELNVMEQCLNLYKTGELCFLLRPFLAVSCQ